MTYRAIAYYIMVPLVPSVPASIYSQTSDSGPSEIGTQYNKPLYKGRVPNNWFACGSNTFLTSEKRTTSLQRTKDMNLYCSQSVLCSEV